MKKLVSLLLALSFSTVLATIWCLSATATTYASMDITYAKHSIRRAHDPAQWNLFSYGQEFPSAQNAVNWIYGPTGTWQNLTNVEYKWNYYPQYATVNHPFDKTSLVQYADGSHQATTRDANGHLLLDFNHDGEIDSNSGGAAFEEHSGRGMSNQSISSPFSNFWFDDNWLARYMSIAYNMPQPNGLHQYNDFTRWAILGGDPSHWYTYDSEHLDELALDGLYYISSFNDLDSAFQNWSIIKTLSGDTYDSTYQRHTFPRISDTYQLGLFKILTDKLLLALDVGSDSFSYGRDNAKRMLSNYSVDLGIDIISAQVQDASCPGGQCSWVSGIVNGQPDSNTVMNTESTAVEVLALGASGLYTYEAGKSPLSYTTTNNYFVRPYHAISAVTGQSSPGYLSYGPYENFPAGSHTVDFYLRAPHPQGAMTHIDIDNSRPLWDDQRILASQDVQASDMTSGNKWTRISVPINVHNPSNSLEFRVWWYGTANMDLASITLR